MGRGELQQIQLAGACVQPLRALPGRAAGGVQRLRSRRPQNERQQRGRELRRQRRGFAQARLRFQAGAEKRGKLHNLRRRHRLHAGPDLRRTVPHRGREPSRRSERDSRVRLCGRVAGGQHGRHRRHQRIHGGIGRAGADRFRVPAVPARAGQHPCPALFRRPRRGRGHGGEGGRHQRAVQGRGPRGHPDRRRARGQEVHGRPRLQAEQQPFGRAADRVLAEGEARGPRVRPRHASHRAHLADRRRPGGRPLRQPVQQAAGDHQHRLSRRKGGGRLEGTLPRPRQVQLPERRGHLHRRELGRRHEVVGRAHERVSLEHRPEGLPGRHPPILQLVPEHVHPDVLPEGGQPADPPPDPDHPEKRADPAGRLCGPRDDPRRFHLLRRVGQPGDRSHRRHRPFPPADHPAARQPRDRRHL